MSYQSLSPDKNRFKRPSPFAVVASQSRRTGHGGSLWSLPLSVRALRQPQDGTPETPSRLANIANHLQNNILLEPEDAGLTGGTRSLTRRLLGLNISSRRKSPESIVPAAVRALVA